jgi:hypothetical protein
MTGKSRGGTVRHVAKEPACPGRTSGWAKAAHTCPGRESARTLLSDVPVDRKSKAFFAAWFCTLASCAAHATSFDEEDADSPRIPSGGDAGPGPRGDAAPGPDSPAASDASASHPDAGPHPTGAADSGGTEDADQDQDSGPTCAPAMSQALCGTPCTTPGLICSYGPPLQGTTFNCMAAPEGGTVWFCGAS